MLVKGYKLSVVRRISSGDLIHSMVTSIINTVFYTWMWAMCCGGLSLFIVMLSARNAWITWLRPYYVWEPSQTFPWPESMLWLVWPLWFLLRLQHAHKPKTIREPRRPRFITHRFWRVHSTPEGDTAKSQERREGGAGTWGSASLGSEGWGVRLSWVHHLLANLKHSSQN